MEGVDVHQSAAAREGSVAGRRARATLLVASALGCSLSVFVAAGPAVAGPVPSGACGAISTVSTGQDQVTCSSVSGTGNPYPSGITYAEPGANDLTVVLLGSGSLSAVNVNTTGTGVSAFGGTGGQAVTVNAYAGASIAAQLDGIDAFGHGAGAIAINNGAAISANNHGLWTYSYGNGAATVVNTGAISIGTGNMTFGVGIIAGATNGDASVTNSAAITVNTTTATASGIVIGASGAETLNNNAGGVISVTGTGDVRGLATSNNHYATSVSIYNAAAVTATSTGATGSATGIEVGNVNANTSTTYTAQTATVDLAGAGNVTATGYAATGVLVHATGNITINGYGSTAIAANSSGGGGAGVYANSSNGTISVAVNKVSTTGAYTAGLNLAGYGNVGVTANTVSTTGAYSAGVQASSSHGYVTVNLASVSTQGASSDGVTVTAAGTGTQVTVGSVSTQGPSSVGIYAYSAAGPVKVTATSVSTQGASSDGVQASSRAGAVTIDVGGVANNTTYGVTTKGANSAGVSAYSLTGGVTAANHTFIQTYGAGSDGITVAGKSGTVAAYNLAGATIHTRGQNAYGMAAYTRYGSAKVSNAGTVITEGQGAVGLSAGANTSPSITSTATATVTNTGSVTTSGAGATGISATGFAGAYVTTGAVTTKGNGAAGVVAISQNGPAQVDVTGAISTSGYYAAGVVARAYNGDATITLNGAVTTTGAATIPLVDPAHASSIGGRNFSSAKYGAAAAGAFSQTGTATVTGSKAVSATGAGSDGVVAVGYTGATVNITGPVTATGATGTKYGSGGVGVTAISDKGSASVTVGSVTSYNTSVFAISGGGNASITINGAVKSSNKYGALAFADYSAKSTNTATITVASGASVTARYAGVLAVGGGAANVYNNGVITVTSAANAKSSEYIGAAAFSENSTATVTNTGTINGLGTGGLASKGKYAAALAYSETSTAAVVNTKTGVINGQIEVRGYTGSTFSNAGVWNAIGTSYVGTTGTHAVAGTVINSGTVNVAPGATTATTVSVDNVGTWTNTGVINITNGHTGDVLNLGTAAFVGAGSSTLALDVSLSNSLTSDKLIAGAVSGVTTVQVTDVSPSSTAAMNFVGATLAQGTSGAAGDFALSGPVHKGFVDYGIYYNPTAVTWNLVGLPDHAAFETMKLPSLGQSFDERSSDVWFARTQEIRDASALNGRPDGFEVWGQAYGGQETNDRTQGFDVGPFSFSENLSTKSSWAGVQAGVDHVQGWMGGRLLWGVTVGYLEQDTSFRSGMGEASWAGGGLTDSTPASDRFALKGANVGMYVGFAKDGWFFNGLLKGDFDDVDVKLNSLQLDTTTRINTLGLAGEAGYHLGGQGLFVEPVVKLQGGSTSVNDWGGLGATVNYADAGSLLTQVGARFGGQARWAAGQVVVTPYLGAYWVDQTMGNNVTTFATGPASIGLRDTPARGFARIDFGATAKTFYGLEGFAKAGVDTGSGLSGWTADVGLRWKF